VAEHGKYRDLMVCQKAMDLVEAVHRVTRGFPPDEKFGLTAQLRRAASSIPMNIAEGNCRGTRRDYAQFVSIATGSVGEVDTGLLIAIRPGYATEAEAKPSLDLVTEVAKMLRALRRRLPDNPGPAEG
jgi:four helix bundle protein